MCSEGHLLRDDRRYMYAICCRKFVTSDRVIRDGVGVSRMKGAEDSNV
jgi:hypothetical protein